MWKSPWSFGDIDLSYLGPSRMLNLKEHRYVLNINSIFPISTEVYHLRQHLPVELLSWVEKWSIQSSASFYDRQILCIWGYKSDTTNVHANNRHIPSMIPLFLTYSSCNFNYEVSNKVWEGSPKRLMGAEEEAISSLWANNSRSVLYNHCRALLHLDRTATTATTSMCAWTQRESGSYGWREKSVPIKTKTLHTRMI